MNKGWTSKMRANNFPNNFTADGKYRGEFWTKQSFEKRKEYSQDAKNRKLIIDAIEEEIKKSEGKKSIELVAKQIAQIEKVKKAFEYLEQRTGKKIEDIFTEWYNSYQKSKKRSNNIIIR